MSATRSLRRDTGGARCERDPEEVPEQLPELRHDVVRLGARDSEGINGGTQALLDCDRAGADRVISGDACLDELTDSIEERTTGCSPSSSRWSPTSARSSLWSGTTHEVDSAPWRDGQHRQDDPPALAE